VLEIVPGRRQPNTSAETGSSRIVGGAVSGGCWIPKLCCWQASSHGMSMPRYVRIYICIYIYIYIYIYICMCMYGYVGDAGERVCT
jgi:hypothetical protein